MAQKEQERRPELEVGVPHDEAAEEVPHAQAAIEREGDLTSVVDDPACRGDAAPVAKAARAESEVCVPPRLRERGVVNPFETFEELVRERESHPRQPFALGDGLRLSNDSPDRRMIVPRPLQSRVPPEPKILRTPSEVSISVVAPRSPPRSSTSRASSRSRFSDTSTLSLLRRINMRRPPLDRVLAADVGRPSPPEIAVALHEVYVRIVGRKMGGSLIRRAVVHNHNHDRQRIAVPKALEATDRQRKAPVNRDDDGRRRRIEEPHAVIRVALNLNAAISAASPMTHS